MKMRAVFSWRRVAICAILGVAIAAGLSADTSQIPAYELPPNGQVTGFLLQSVDWYRHIYAEEKIATDPSDLLFLDDNRPIATQIVRLSFEFAKADAAMAKAVAPREESAATAHVEAASSDLARFIALQSQTNQARQKLTQEVDRLKQEVAAAHGAEHRKLQAALDDSQSRLDLIEAGSKIVQGMVEFVQSAGTGQGQNEDLTSAINYLAQTVPEVNNPAVPVAKLPMQDVSSKAAGSGHEIDIFGLASDISTLGRKLDIIDEATRLTDSLALSEQSLRNPMASALNRLVPGVLNTLQSSNPSGLQEQKSRLDALTVELNGVSPAVVALDKQKILLAIYKSHLSDWRSTVVNHYKQAWKRLIVRLFVVALIIALLAGLSVALRRVAARHVHDPDRRRLITLGRRAGTLVAMIVVIIVGLAADFSSMATFFGLLTAGVAVAFQNVIIGTAGYVLLVGKRGIRIGDRVQFSGVTGDVTDIGLLQFQLKEYDLEKQQYTGHVATFSNSFVFLSPSSGLLKWNAARAETPEEAGIPAHSNSMELSPVATAND